MTHPPAQGFDDLAADGADGRSMSPVPRLPDAPKLAEAP
jgi:hypothetical protein